ncbi:hypothetical protein QQ045_006700 [Rhodiola kirilowii]
MMVAASGGAGWVTNVYMFICGLFGCWVPAVVLPGAYGRWLGRSCWFLMEGLQSAGGVMRPALGFLGPVGFGFQLYRSELVRWGALAGASGSDSSSLLEWLAPLKARHQFLCFRNISFIFRIELQLTYSAYCFIFRIDILGLELAGWTLDQYGHSQLKFNEIASTDFASNLKSLTALMRYLLKSLQDHPDSWPFREPVGEDDAPDYYDIIKDPMAGQFYFMLLKPKLTAWLSDLKTMSTRVESQQYYITFYYIRPKDQFARL